MPIIATAAGVVTESGKRSGYGLMVEIEHGNGLVTRYAHAKSLNVSVGDIVSKGQTIALMGSTGRSTGPHVHYEVLKNGRQINPNYYIQRKSA
jgi:murein DD-endopeptidase MepM/ murein hydrolase activator NlpD